jgi:hypothetical protein
MVDVGAVDVDADIDVLVFLIPSADVCRTEVACMK